MTVLENTKRIYEGVHFLGCTLWTDFNLFGEGASVLARMDAQTKMNDYRVIRVSDRYRRLRPDDTHYYFQQSLSFLKRELAEPFDGPTVVITHHAPSMRSISQRYRMDPLTPAYASNLDDLMGPHINLWIHGHVHHSNDDDCHGTRVVSNPRGYQEPHQGTSGNPDFVPCLTIEI